MCVRDRVSASLRETECASERVCERRESVCVKGARECERESVSNSGERESVCVCEREARECI